MEVGRYKFNHRKVVHHLVSFSNSLINIIQCNVIYRWISFCFVGLDFWLASGLGDAQLTRFWLTIHEQTWHHIDENVLVFRIIGAVSAIHVALNSLLYIPKSFMYTRPNIKVYIYIWNSPVTMKREGCMLSPWRQQNSWKLMLYFSQDIR